MSLQNLRLRLERLPMLRALVPFAAGIVLADRYALPDLFVWIGFLLCGGMACVRRSSLYTVAALLLFGWGLSGLHATPPDPLPRGIRTVFALTVGEQGSAQITAWRDDEHGRWHEARSRVVLHTDSTLMLRAGEKIVFRGFLHDFPARYPAYGASMRRRGYAGTVWLTERQLWVRKPAQGASLHTAAVERLERLGLSAQAQALCAAMAAGERSALDRPLRTTYARSGTAHLLAVSGLHVGIVFLLANALLGWLPALRRGHLVRNGAAVALIWIYAATAGFSPSVVRAALMFTALQGSMAWASAYVSGNILAATAFGMLLWNPAWLFDLSFQLSFTAVAAILAWGVPLYSRLRTRIRLLDAAIAAYVVGLTATVATAPLTAHAFGMVSLAGFVVNPVVIPLASVVVFASVVWMAVPLAFAAPVFRFLLETAAVAQNGLIARAAELPWAAVPCTLTTVHTAALYLLLAGITLLAWCANPKKKVSLRR